MPIMQSLLVLAPALALLLSSTLPRKLTDRRIPRWRQFVSILAGLQCVAAGLTFVSLLGRLLRGDAPVVIEVLPATLSLHLDGFSTLMLCLVSSVGFVVTRFSIRYLDGDENQGHFFRWLAMTVGGVSLFVVSGNLLMMLAAWILASLGLHQLLLHYSDRPAASNAAWVKFAISRIGDAFFIAAIALIYHHFGSFELAAVFSSLENGVGSGTWSRTVIALLIILSAVTKSAQFPLHGWLPNTLEAPTPVSALMHAGIVNAGGYLVIRLSPLLVEAPVALSLLAIIGTITVAYAGIVMMTQPSIKRSLAYSTIAQMGFMMLQCGIGAFSAAMLHILAHSLYKAYAFLNSGSVLTEAEGRRSPEPEALRPMYGADFVGGIVLAVTSVVVSAMLFRNNFMAKPGGLVIGFVLTLAITNWLWDVFRLNSLRATVQGLTTAGGLAVLYMSGYFVVNHLVRGSVPTVHAGVMSTVATIVALFVFCALFGLNCLRSTERGQDLLVPLHVHASNGFYIHAVTQRILAFRKL